MTDDFFINNILLIAEKCSQRSSDPTRKVGAVITDNKFNVIAKGFNEFPDWVDKSRINEMSKDTKGMVIDHAEISALIDLNKMDDKYHIAESYIFITCYSCKWCCESIVTSKFNITKIYYQETKLSPQFKKRFCLHETGGILENGNIELIKVRM